MKLFKKMQAQGQVNFDSKNRMVVKDMLLIRGGRITNNTGTVTE